MKKIMLIFIISLLFFSCIGEEDDNFYRGFTHWDGSQYTLSFITNNEDVRSGYVTGPDIDDTTMVRYRYVDGIWINDASGTEKAFTFYQLRTEAKKKYIWEAYVDNYTGTPVENRDYTMNLTLKKGSKKKTVPIVGYCEAGPEIITPSDNGTAGLTPVFKWDIPKYTGDYLGFPVTSIPGYQDGWPVKANGCLLNIRDSSESIVWTYREYSPNATSALYVPDENLGTLTIGETYTLEVRFIDYGYNSSSDEVTFTVE